MTQKSKSRSLRVCLYLCIVLVVSWAISEYFSPTYASLEKQYITLSLGTLKRCLQLQQYLGLPQTLEPKVCHGVLPSNLQVKFIQDDRLLYVTENEQTPRGKWGYNTNLTHLVYHVDEQAYFKSRSGTTPFIVIKIKKTQNKVELEVSEFEWCSEMGWWKCERW